MTRKDIGRDAVLISRKARPAAGGKLLLFMEGGGQLEVEKNFWTAYPIFGSRPPLVILAICLSVFWKPNAIFNMSLFGAKPQPINDLWKTLYPRFNWVWMVI